MVTDSVVGQISGFTTMTDFKQRFAEYNAATGEYAFSNVRNGLIVGLVCPNYLHSFLWNTNN
jgi:hypothetical protein